MFSVICYMCALYSGEDCFREILFTGTSIPMTITRVFHSNIVIVSIVKLDKIYIAKNMQNSILAVYEEDCFVSFYVNTLVNNSSYDLNKTRSNTRDDLH
jgi:hypothetical protein